MNAVLMYVFMCLVCRFKAPGGGFRNLKFDHKAEKSRNLAMVLKEKEN